MKDIPRWLFFRRLFNKKAHFPFTGQIELTYRCSLNCVHCYCKGVTGIGQWRGVKELTTEEWKKILDILQKEGCMNLCMTGGDPLMRDDFLEIYAYAKSKGFVLVLFTDGQALTNKIINYLAKSPPYSIEITLNSISRRTYESITQTPGSFTKVIRTIRMLKEKKLPLILKMNCLKQNKQEVGRLKAFTKELLGKTPKNRFRFKYDPMIHPRLDGDRTPCEHRLSFKEILEVKTQDPDIWKSYQKGLKCEFRPLKRNKDFLYQCDVWRQQFFINPYGHLKFCDLSDKFSVNLKTTSFKEGFYNVFPKVLNEKFRTDSKCRNCALRAICFYCPARAYLETGNEETPVPYYCELAEGTARMKIKWLTDK